MNIPDKLNTMTIEAPQPDLWIVRFNRPDVLNALDTATCEDLRTIFGPLVFTPGDLRCIVLTGTGKRAFSAGGDLKQRHGMSDDDWRLQHAIIEEGVLALVNSSVPVIAAVNGAAFGGGCELALCCDFIHASTTARFGLPEVTRGILPGGGGTQNLPRAVGERRAKEIILTGAPFSAQEALDWGLVNAIHEPDNSDAGRARRGARHLPQCAGLGAAGQEGDPLRPADGPDVRVAVGNPGLRTHDPDTRPPRGRRRLQ